MSGELPFRRKAHAGGEEGGTDSWLMSYADMITLLLCFFIIFVSTSEPKEDKLAAATSGLKGTFGSVDLSTPFTGTLRALEGIVDSNQAYQSMSVEKIQRGLQIELSSSLLFPQDSAELNPARIPMLTDMATALKSGEFTDYQVTIEGYTDNAEPSNGLYASNWELSAARAARLVRFFVQQGYDPARMRAEAFGGWHPKVPNLDARGSPIPENQERNRRVVIKLERRL